MRIPGTDFEYGRPQFFATLLLLAFLIQAVLFASNYPRTEDESFAVGKGLSYISGDGRLWFYLCCPPPQQLTELLAALPVGLRGLIGIDDAVWLPRVGFLSLTVFLGSAVWWVARRLYGNAGGYIALSLYCFSPLSVFQTLAVNHVGLALGWFSIVFLAIGLAHNLYAPPKHWLSRSVLLLVALLAGINFNAATAFAVPVAIGMMLYLAPGRRLAVFAVWIVIASVVALIGNAVAALAKHFLPIVVEMPTIKGIFQRPEHGELYLFSLGAGVIGGFLISVGWRRARYFGNFAPVLVVATVVLLARYSYHVAWGPAAFVFAYIFIAGICADLLETRYRQPVLIGIGALLTAHAANGLYTVFRIATHF